MTLPLPPQENGGHALSLFLFSTTSARPGTKGTAQRRSDNKPSGMASRLWPTRRILLPFSDRARLCSMGQSLVRPSLNTFSTELRPKKRGRYGELLFFDLGVARKPL